MEKKTLNTPPHLSMDSTTSLKVKIVEREGVWARSSVHNTLGVEGHVEASR
jgi:hypothetical protein